MCQNICGPLSPLRAPWWESQEMLWLVADRRAAGDWKTRRSDDCQWLGSASNYWLASNDWTAIVSSITFISSITSARYLTGHSARGTCAVRARPGRGNVQAVQVTTSRQPASNLVSCMLSVLWASLHQNLEGRRRRGIYVHIWPNTCVYPPIHTSSASCPLRNDA